MKTFTNAISTLLHASLAVALLCSAASAHALNKNERIWERQTFSAQPYVQSHLPDGQARAALAYQLKRHLLEDGTGAPVVSKMVSTRDSQQSTPKRAVACNEATGQDHVPNAQQLKRLSKDGLNS
jgi:hypothetical protein